MKHSAPLLAAAASIAIGTTSAAMAADKIDLLVMPFLSQAPFFIAMEEGYFAEQDIEVVPAKFNSFAAIVPGVMTGEFDMAMMSGAPSLFNSIAKGAKGRIVAPAIVLSKGACEYFSFVGRGGVAWDNLAAGEPLRATVSAEPASVNQFLADQITKLPGASEFTYDIRLVPPHAELDALKAGSVDLAATTEPWVTRTGRSGAGTTVFGGSELYEDFQYSFFMMSPRLVSEDPDLGARVMRAVSAGVAQYNKGKTDRNIEIISKYTKLDGDFLKEACWADIPGNVALDAEAVGALQDWYLENGFIEETLPADAYYQSF